MLHIGLWWLPGRVAERSLAGPEGGEPGSVGGCGRSGREGDEAVSERGREGLRRSGESGCGAEAVSVEEASRAAFLR